MQGENRRTSAFGLSGFYQTRFYGRCYAVANGGALMPTRFLLEDDHAFSPDEVKNLVDAFEDTLRVLDLTDRDDPVSIRVAKIIIGLAKDGERDPLRLRDLALKFVRPE
jgi:hypothetical protein